ncbi:MAG: GAF domain-containing protein [Chloroflexi bacterium]|nr:GAF domain-containing protein [Chloroflexota bacterium]
MDKKPTHTRVSETQRYTLIGAVFGFLFPLVGTSLRILVSGLPLDLPTMLNTQLTDPILWVVDTAPLVLALFAGYAGRKQDMLSKANEELSDREHELKINQLTLEQRVTERTAELENANQRNMRRSAQFESIARVARTIRSSQTLETLLPSIADSISEQFGFYHVGIFLLDNSKEYAILVAANSEGGKRMLLRNHRLLVGGTGIVGYVTKSGQPRVALDVGQDSAYFNNPDLPDTHSEIALPLRVSTDVFGALDVQSLEINAFSQEDVSILSALADQVSIAIQNARSLQQAREALAQVESSSAQTGKQQWYEFIEQQPEGSYIFDGIDAKKISQTKNESPAGGLAIPLTLRGVRIGTLKLSAATDINREWTSDEIAIARATAERTALALENARLLQEAQKRAAKERAVGQISARIGNLVNLENLLKTTIQELGSQLPDTEIAIQLTSEKLQGK